MELENMKSFQELNRLQMKNIYGGYMDPNDTEAGNFIIPGSCNSSTQKAVKKSFASDLTHDVGEPSYYGITYSEVPCPC